MYCLNYYKSVTAAYSYVDEAVIFDSPAEIAKFFDEGLAEYAAKDDVPLFNFCVYNEGEDRQRAKFDGIPDHDFSIRRCSANCIAISAIVLDYDANKTIQEALEILGDLECIIYTTFRHTAAKNKFRIILPLSRLLLKEEMDLKYDGLMKRFPGVDSASFSTSQAFYFPSHSTENKDEAFVFHVEGELFDPDTIEDKVIVPSPVVQRAPYTGPNNYLAKLMKCLLTGKGLRYGGKYGVIPLATLVKSAGGSVDDLMQVVTKIRDFDSCLNEQAILDSIRKKTWKEVGDQFGVDKRTALLKELGCSPYPISSGSIPRTGEALALQQQHKELMDKITKLQKSI